MLAGRYYAIQKRKNQEFGIKFGFGRVLVDFFFQIFVRKLDVYAFLHICLCANEKCIRYVSLSVHMFVFFSNRTDLNRFPMTLRPRSLSFFRNTSSLPGYKWHWSNRFRRTGLILPSPSSLFASQVLFFPECFLKKVCIPAS